MYAVIAVYNSLSVRGDHDTLQILLLLTDKSLVEKDPTGEKLIPRKQNTFLNLKRHIE
jgi:hypothetical protein